MKQISSNLKSVEWLKEHLSDPDLVILDASMVKMPNGDLIPPAKSCIPGAKRFNYDTEICDQSSDLPHMMPSEKEFQAAVQYLSINNNSTIVVYDRIGVFASPRAWWMFKVMGHQDVYVLDGGYPKWQEANYPTEPNFSTSNSKGDFCATLDAKKIAQKNDISLNINNQSKQLIDARSLARFHAKEPEPRPGLIGGHIPNSICLPFTDLLDDGLMKSLQQLDGIFTDRLTNQNKNIIFSCGSGVTACILALGASECGLENYSVYDGSWTEWALDESTPKVEK